jgi:O-antigen ligase
MIIFALAFLKTDLAIGILVVSMLLSPELELGAVAGRSVVLRFDDIFLFVIFFGWLAKLAIFKELGVLKKTPLNGPIIVYVLVCVLSTALSLIEGQGSVKTSFFYLVKYFEYFLVYFLVVNNIHSLRQVKIFVNLMILVCVAACLYGLYNYFTTGMRVTAPFEGLEGEANTLSGYLVLLMAIMMGLLLYYDSRRMRFVLFMAMGVSVLALIFTLSRSGWISFIFMYLVFIFVSRRSKPVLIMGFIVMLFLGPLLTPRVVHERVAETFRYGKTYEFFGHRVKIDESGSARIDAWQKGFKKLAEKPLLGHGVPGAAVVDNQYTLIMTETGLAGLAAFLFLLLTIFRRGFYAMKETEGKSGYAYGLSVGFLAGFSGLVAHASTAATFILIRIMEPFWFFMAIVVSLPTLVVASRDPHEVMGT